MRESIYVIKRAGQQTLSDVMKHGSDCVGVSVRERISGFQHMEVCMRETVYREIGSRVTKRRKRRTSSRGGSRSAAPASGFGKLLAQLGLASDTLNSARSKVLR
jgi:hypothetical protein